MSDLCKAQRLAIAGYVAPILRSKAHKAATRKITVIDSEGKPED